MDELVAFTNEEEDLSVTDLLGYLIHRVNYKSDKQTANVWMSTYEQTYLDAKNFSHDDDIAIMHDLTLTKVQMRKLKAYLSEKGIHLPNTADLIESRKELRGAHLKVGIRGEELIF